MSYKEFLAKKDISDIASGISEDVELHPSLKKFQSACTRWSLRRGRALLAEGCGLGKTRQGVEWMRVVQKYLNKPVLALAPLAVAQQTIEEAASIGVEIKYAREQSQASKGITITNYEMLHKFEAREFGGVWGDELSIIKSHTGKIRNQIIEMFNRTPFRLGTSATPAPNDYEELGNHCEFLSILKRMEMLSTFFCHDGGTGKWILKPHGRSKFWNWMASWAICIEKPADIGFDDVGYDLPPLNIHKHILECKEPADGFLFAMPATSMSEQRSIKRNSIEERVGRCADLVNSTPGQFVVWGELNDECDMLEKQIENCVQVSGKDSMEEKEEKLLAFTRGEVQRIVSKASIAGLGLNWQRCSNMAFVNLSHSFEDQYQAIRRCWRFGQESEVDVHLFMMDVEQPILENVNRKNTQADMMMKEMVQFMETAMKSNLKSAKRENSEYKPTKKLKLPSWMK